MRVFFLFLLYLNKAKAQISFLIPNIDTGEGMKEWSGVAQLYQTLSRSGQLQGPESERHKGVAAAWRATPSWRREDKKKKKNRSVVFATSMRWKASVKLKVGTEPS